ncbi:MAG: L-lactate dehydrogenase [Planctomycetota bacterium]|jgi:L-lactate dehydrogenase
MQTRRKVVIVGAGAVGSTSAYTLMRSGLADEIVLVDLDRERAEGEAMDMNHGLFFAPPVDLHAGDYDDCKGAAVVVITAGAKQKPGQTRLELVSTNVRICGEIMDEITARTRDAVVVVVTNPVDVLTYFALRRSGLPRSRVMGSGTVLDSARFRYSLSRYYNIDPRNVHAYVIGEHGDSEVFLWSQAHLGGIALDSYCEVCKDHILSLDRESIMSEVRNSAYHVIESKGATYYAVSLALERIVGAVLRDERSVLTVSTLVEGQYGIKDVCLSLPCVVDSSGAAHVLNSHPDEVELEGLRGSARVLREVIEKVEADRRGSAGTDEEAT